MYNTTYASYCIVYFVVSATVFTSANFTSILSPYSSAVLVVTVTMTMCLYEWVWLSDG